MSTQDYLGLSPEAHRIVPISASQSLQASAAPAGSGVIPTGLSRLDEAICRDVLEDLPGLSDTRSMGILCGHVTEIFGPPGVGKTSLALNIASNSLREGGKVVWIDTGLPLPKQRLKKLLQNPTNPQEEHEPQSTIPNNPAKDLIYFRTQSLPHLLALLMRPPKDFPPEETTLLIIDSISGPFPSYFQTPTELKSNLTQAGITDKPQIQWLLHRKWNVTSDLGNQLMKLASANRMAVLVINQTHTKIKGHPRATLCPALSGGSWENSIYTRIVLYRDFPEEADDAIDKKFRFAEVLKRTGKPLMLRLEENVIPFMIESDGLREIDKVQQQPCPVSQKSTETSASGTENRRKRKVDEIADSQDEDEDSDEEFGWLEGDDAHLLEGDN